MSDNKLPIQYRVEIYENSLRKDPSWVFESSTPPMRFNIGDYVSHKNLDPQPDIGDKRYKVKEIEHMIYEVKNSHISHSFSVCIEVVDEPFYGVL